MMTLKYLAGQLAGGLCDGSPLGQIPILNVLIQDQAIEFGKKLVSYFETYEFSIQKQAEKIMAHESEKSRDFVVCAAKECFETINAENLLEETHYDAGVLSAEKAGAYLKEQKYLSGEEERLLKTYLPPLVEAAVLQLQLWLVEQPEFLNTAIGITHEKTADLNQWRKSVEARLNALTASKAVHVADLSEELKNLWNDYPFLEWDRENGKKELREFYKLPFGKFKEDDEPTVDLKTLLQETVDSGNDRHKRMLVLMGAPGSGKTTVITYLLNNLKIDRIVRVYPLSSFTNMNPSNWPGDLLAKAGLEQSDLNNSVLILDGLDELNLQGQYDRFVEKLRTAWANNPEITDFTLILTCRTNRLNTNALRCSHVILAPLSPKQISQFAADYLGYCPTELNDCLEKKDLSDVLGIPILLYLVLGLGLTVDSDTSVAGLYDQIFSLDGDNSIYKRSYNQKDHPVTAELAEKIHLFSQDVAVEMFSREEVQEDLEKDCYITLAQKQIGKSSIYTPEDLLIGQYFLLGRKEQKIYFVHRSIFEYFVALSIFNALVELAGTGKSAKQLYREMAPGATCSLTSLAALLSPHHFSDFPEIKDFLHHLIRVHSEKLSDFPDWAELGKLIFNYGLADAVPDRPHGGNRGLIEEEYRFLNLLDICRCILLQTQFGPVDLISQSCHSVLNRFAYWDLLHEVSTVDLSNLNLSGADLSDAYLPEADLSEADLSGASLSGASLSRASLSGANLFHVNLYEVNLSWANLSRANLFGANLHRTSLYGANLYRATLPDNRRYEEALAEDGKDVMLQFTDPKRWNELHPDKIVDPDRV